MDLINAKDAAFDYLNLAEKEILKWFRKEFKVSLKSDQSPVTVADRNAETLLRNKIIKDFPQCGIIGEEFGNVNESAEWVWTIDPIDGTRSFVQGLPLFASLISLLHKGEPVMGIISLPALGEKAWAVKGQGAWLGKDRLQVSSHKKLEGATAAVADIYCFSEKKYKRLFDHISRTASLARTYPDAFGHLMAIRGSVDIMIDPWAYIWDFAPCKILAEEAGGTFANFTGNRKDIREGTALVGNPSLVREIRKWIKK